MKKVLKGRYQVTDKLGKGGSGQVYKVWDVVLEKEWAMKELVSYSVRGEKEKNHEIEILKSLSHPSFPRIVDAFYEEERLFFVMDYISGITLEEYIKKQPLTEKEILEIGIHIAEAILYLHQNKTPLLYLDLKPSNIMIENGIIKIVDFGSVMVKGKKVKISGTFGYASPEQIQLSKEGSLLGEQSDIYSFGMVLFSMIMGGCNCLPVIELKRKKGIRIRKYHTMISAGTEKIIEKATRGNPSFRYTSMRDLIFDMKRSKIILERKKKNLLFKRKNLGEESLPFWQQERSILCCSGKPLIFIGKSLVLFWIFAVVFLLPIKSEAKNKESLKVIIRDHQGRKVLVKKENVYELEKNLILEIPWENFSTDNYEITVECKEGEEVKDVFYLSCKKKK